MLNIKNNMIMKYRVFAMLGMLALTAGSVLAQDYDDIYYDASKSASGTTKVDKKSKTVVVYNDVPDKYKVAAQSNYRVERDEDEYNRRVEFEPELNYEVDINGDTIYISNDSIYDDDLAFANTRRIERFYNPDIVILSDDEDLVELYYDESPTINLVVGTDWGYQASYGWGYSYNPWYTGWYDPWSLAYYSPWYAGWHDPFFYWHSPYYYYNYWHGPSLWGWTYWGPRWGHHHHWTPWYDNLRYWTGSNSGSRRGSSYFDNHGTRGASGRVGYASNRNGNVRDNRSGNRPSGAPGIGTNRGSNGTGSGYTGTRTRTRTDRGGNVGTSGTTTRRGNISSTPTSPRSSERGYYQGGSRSSSASSGSSRSSSSYSGSSRSSSSYSGSSRSSSSYGGSSRSSSSGSYSGGSRSSGGSYSGGGSSHSSSGGSSSGGGRRH